MKIIKSALAILFALCVTVSHAGEKTITMIVAGDDSDKNAAKRNTEVYKRVVAELQQSLIKKNIYVVDEDMVSAKLNLGNAENRDKQTIIKSLAIANEKKDAKVRSRFALIFTVYPNVQEMSVTKKLSARVRGQLYDLKNLRALNSFDVKTKEVLSIPKDKSLCNDLCVEEKIGDLSVGIASELGLVLVDNFNDMVRLEVESRAPKGKSSETTKQEQLQNTYTVTIVSQEKTSSSKIAEMVGNAPGVDVELIKATGSERVYAVKAGLTLKQVENRFEAAAKKFGVESKNITVK